MSLSEGIRMTASTATIPVETITVEAKLLDDHAAGVTVVQSPPSPEQVRASEAVFSQQEQEAKACLGLLGIWTSTVLLHDLALEHFWTSRDDEEDEARQRKATGLLPDGMGND
ncbi:MAG: hypothetical protein HYS12_04980 [Planctomycetes bacterium]|nr:hypothetical protein [Planctomycetota bacterium]